MPVKPEAKPQRAPTSPHRGFGNHAVRLGELVLARAEAALAPLDLKALAYDTMICILDGHGMSQQDLSRRLGIYAPKMVGLLDDLEKRGLVERKINPSDRRRHELVLTTSGHDILQRAAVIGAALEEELFGGIPDKDKAHFIALVQQLEARVRMHEVD
tara:strand:+ start:758 stop:1231 length:474 start_codon:yes stop_codon:yes gene_type:complete